MKLSRSIPFLDLVTPHLELEDDLVSVFKTALKSAAFIGGSMVEQFETDFSAFCGTRYCIGVSSGTDALRFALMAADIRNNEIVITVPNTFIATAEAISQSGALPHFVDIHEQTYNMDPEKLREYLEVRCEIDDNDGRPVHRVSGKKVSAIIPVHLYGQPADMDSILSLAQRYHLTVIEDACQAHGAGYLSRHKSTWFKAGSMGVAAAFSFYPGKNLGACGEAGAVTTNSEEIARKIRMLRDHGQAQKYHHDMEGYNGRLDAIQAGFLSVKLKHLPKWNKQRQECACRYKELLGGLHGIILPFEPSWAKSVYHLYVIRVQDRTKLQKQLAENGIAAGLHYPIPLHRQKAYAAFDFAKCELPVTERVASELLTLPIYPGLSGSDQRRIAESIARCLNA
ncbi:MAG: DegT/DnrJ/EryC1/StrS family aminotransferase [Desulforhabdus sp.]|jgi:dTDP-4-amino-4,6-dideoxygalactose transaminase|nr:DegT/DnrJ/EryC1/StrS family aminotransferase [Desulforhabdus sp.]